MPEKWPLRYLMTFSIAIVMLAGKATTTPNIHVIGHTGEVPHKYSPSIEAPRIEIDTTIGLTTASDAGELNRVHPDLWAMLRSSMRQNERVPVDIWLAPRPGESLSARERRAVIELSARYPEARQAVAAGRLPWEISDQNLARSLQDEFTQLVASEPRARVQSFLEFLGRAGVEAHAWPGDTPMVSALVPLAMIASLENNPNVDMIYPQITTPPTQFMHSAIQTVRAGPVHRSGIRGNGVTIAILESYNIDSSSNTPDCPADSNNCFLNPIQSRPAVGSLQTEHATIVASAPASNHPFNRGVAPWSSLLSAGIQSQEGTTYPEEAVNALLWAINNGADIINMSEGICTSTGAMTQLDRAFDYHLRVHRKFLVVAAGNISTCLSEFVISPAKAFNVVSVGSLEDLGDPNWGNDTWYSDSSWKNPTSEHGDREKPEAMAPGTNLSLVGNDGNVAPHYGTSLASPQVAGLAALLIETNSNLASWAEAIRAIIFATSNNNVDGQILQDPTIDDKDGHGGINSTLAISAATNRGSASSPCSSPCWWGELITDTEFPVQTYLDRYFVASDGDLIRIAISWWSDADGPPTYSDDSLSTNLDLQVFDPNNNPVTDATSESLDNNYEVVQFTADTSGTYRIGILKESSEGILNYLGIAWATLEATPADNGLFEELTSYWNMDEPSEARRDSHGLDHLEEEFVEVLSSPGIINSAAQFSLSDQDHLLTADNEALSMTDEDFTLAAWIYLDSKQHNQTFIKKYEAAQNFREYLVYYDGGADRIKFNVCSTGSWNNSTCHSVLAHNLGSPEIGAWYLVIAWHDADANQISIQVNDISPNSTSHTTGVWDGPSPFRVGDSSGARIDEVGVWNRLLTPAERTTLYNQGNGQSYPLPGGMEDSLVSFWRMDEASGTRQDSHGGNDLLDSPVASEPGIQGNSAVFPDTSTDHLAVQDTADLSMVNNSFSLSAWVRLNSKAHNQELVSKYDASIDQREYLVYYDGSADRFKFNVCSTGEWTSGCHSVQADEIGSPEVGVWYLIIAWYDKDLGTINIQVNDSDFNIQSHTSGSWNGTEPFRVGEFSEASIDEVAIWKRVLSSSERLQLYNSGSGITYPFP